MANAVRPIPQGLHIVTPGLVVRGAAQAIDFYKKALGAQEIMRMPGPDGKIMHAELRIGDSVIFISDEVPGMGTPSRRRPSAAAPAPTTFRHNNFRGFLGANSGIGSTL